MRRIEDKEETTDDDLVGRAKDDSVSDEMPERAGERPPEVDVAPPVLLGAADEVPSHVAVPAPDNNWDAETVPVQGQRAASTNDALTVTRTPAGAAVAGRDADAHDRESQSGSEKVQDLIRSMERTNIR